MLIPEIKCFTRI